MVSNLAKSIIAESDTVDGSFETVVSKVNAFGAESIVSVWGEVKVCWRLDFEAKSWGVKSLDTVIESADANLNIELDAGKEQKFNAAWSTDQANGWKVKVIHDDLRFPIDLHPKSVELQLTDKVMEIQF